MKNSLIEEDEKNKNLIFNQLNKLFTLFKKNLGRSVCSDTVWSVCVFSPAYCLT